jgi:uncharacterized protein (TIGR02231 family)
MKTQSFVFRSLAALLLCGAALPGTATAEQIAKVVVYPDRAQVTRVAQVPCGDKVMTRFLAIPPAADAASVRAQVDLPGGRVLGVRTEEQVRAEAFSKAVEELDEKIRRIDLEIAALNEQRARDRSVDAIASRYEDVALAQLGRELVDPTGATPAQLPRAWAAALEAPLKVRLEHAASGAQIEAKQRELRRRREELAQKRRKQQAAATRRELIAEVLIACPADAQGGNDRKAQVELTYLVGGAGWTPAHEARLADAGGAVEVSSYATITQRTGEDWKDAQVIVSTAIPRQNATPPEIVPLRISATERTPPKKLLVSRVEEQKHLSAAGSTAVTGKEDANEKNTGGLRLVEQGLSVQFISQTPGDILGDGTPARIRIARAELRGGVKYRTVPKLQPFVFRVADLVNTAGYPLLAGPIDVFRQGQFLARYDVERVAAGERFQLSFGLVDRVKVKRQIIEEIERDKGLFGSTRRHRYAYRFELENYLGTAEEIELSEHIPVSELDEVKVAFDGKTTAGYELRAADGIVTYKVKLAPGERKSVELVYYVDAPASMLGE